jgi:mono/diheme cytochrome c family protein
MKRALFLVVAFLGCTGKFVREVSPEPVPQSEQQIERGKYLVDAVAACGACHSTHEGSLAGREKAGGYLAGGNAIEDPGNFKIYCPNLTSDAETGLGKWSDDQIARAIRDGVDDEGNLLFPVMPFPEYQHISDEDVRAIVGYLRTVPKVHQDAKPFDREIPFKAKIAIKLGMLHHAPARNVHAPDPKDRIATGKYLMHIGHCEGCHALGSRGTKDENDDSYMGGSDKPFDTPGVGKVWASNLTPDPEFGIGKYSDAQVKEALRSGLSLREGMPILYPMSDLLPHIKEWTDSDLDALLAYLRTLKPVHKQTPQSQVASK